MTKPIKRRTDAERKAFVNELFNVRGRHPYVYAHDAFVAGNMTVAQAVAMVASDREFIAESELGILTDRYQFEDVLAAARHVVENVWRMELIERARGRS
jgi:hypothetical protein